jgi:hypothetical protein
MKNGSARMQPFIMMMMMTMMMMMMIIIIIIIWMCLVTGLFILVLLLNQW